MNGSSDEQLKRSNRAWQILLGILALEIIGALWLVWLTAQGALTHPDQPFQDLVGLMLMALCGLLWALVVFAGAWKRRGWARAASITLQFVVGAIGLGVLQGLFADTPVGIALLFVAAAGSAAALITRSDDQTPLHELEAREQRGQG